jgi:hypothetical protein
MKKRITTAGRTVKARVRGSLDRKGPTTSKTIATYLSASKKAEITWWSRMTKSLRWGLCRGERVVDSLAILVAAVATVAIIINAVFLQSDRVAYEPEHPVTKLQKTQEALKSERERLQHKIGNASARN